MKKSSTKTHGGKRPGAGRPSTGRDPVRAMRLGRPTDEIVRYASEHEIDLIVMGTHGREGVARMLLGSVAEKVVRRAACPVLTVHHPEREFVLADEPDLEGRMTT